MNSQFSFIAWRQLKYVKHHLMFGIPWKVNKYNKNYKTQVDENYEFYAQGHVEVNLLFFEFWGCPLSVSGIHHDENVQLLDKQSVARSCGCNMWAAMVQFL